MSKTRVLQQGEADGLCGIYAVMNFLQKIPGWRERHPNDALYWLLESVSRLGWLDAHHLTKGFFDFQLKAILDDQIKNFRLPFKTCYVEDYRKFVEAESFLDLANVVARKKGAIIANHDSRIHWLLVKSGREGKPSCFDSANKNQSETTLGAHHTSLSLEWGVVVLPSKVPSPEGN